MMRRGKAKWIVLAAISAVPVLSAVTAMGQVRAGTDGAALDANPRVGSGGLNTGRSPSTPFGGVTGNQIVTGNVTGGKEFRGTVGYTDPREFRGSVAGSNVDRFIAGSAGVPAPNQGYLLPGEAQPFYGQALATPPPPGFAERGFTGTYTPAPPPGQTSQIFQPDSRMATPNVGELLMRGPLDAQTSQPTWITASPLLGVRQLKPGEMADQDFLSGYPGLRQETALDRLHLDSRTLQKLRDELAAPSDEPGENGAANDGEKSKKTQGQVSAALVKPFESTENTALQGKPLNSAVSEGPLPGDVRPEGSSGRRFVAPQQQSTQYAELQRRLNRYYTDRLETDEQKNREFLKQLKAKEAADRAALEKLKGPEQGGPAGGPQKTGQGAETVTPDYGRISREVAAAPKEGGAPELDLKDLARPMIKRVPVKITSLAAGVKAEGLSKMLKKAEDLMKEGKYTSAVDQYEAAAQVAPNNALVLLGQANAEIGAGLYKKSEQHLRTALMRDPVLTMAQFDLRGMIGEERLDTIVKDLKETARAQEKDAFAPTLLAYVAYNTGNEKQAAVYLDLADRRTGRKDLFYRLLWTHWALPEVPSGGAGGK